MMTMTMMMTLTVIMMIARRLVRLSGIFTEEWCPSPISILPRVVQGKCHSVSVSACSRFLISGYNHLQGMKYIIMNIVIRLGNRYTPKGNE